MKNRNLVTSLLAAIVLFIVYAFMPAQKKIRIFSAGDSTMANNKDTSGNHPARGWMHMFPLFVKDNVEVYNYASPGHSTNSFIIRGIWDKMMKEVRAGDYVFIQFGHNDPKPDSIRHTDARTSFKANLTKFINDTKAKGAYPILFTSIARRVFEPNGKLKDTHGDYVTVVRELAVEMNVPLVDLTAKTTKAIEAMGPDDSKKWFMWVEPGVTPRLPQGFKDNTHLNILGATNVARMAAEGIKELNLPLAQYLDTEGKSSHAATGSPQQATKDPVAENVLRWQRSNGGWPKDSYVIYYDDRKPSSSGTATPKKGLVNYAAINDEEQIKLAAASKDFEDATIDNEHTILEIRQLLQAYKNTNNNDYLEGAKRGIDYLLKAQYSNGGWPQFYPDHRSYKGNITFNDNAMTNVMNLLLDVHLQLNGTAPLGKEYGDKAFAAFNCGVENILKLQLTVNGKPAVWCAQYDPVTLKPVKARSYELPSLSGAESVGIVEVLMRVENPSPAVQQSIRDAVDWFKNSKIEGYRMQKVPDSTQPSGKELLLIPDKNAVLWARFYDLETNKPYYCDRDGVKKNSIFDIGNERRTGYSWLGTWPSALINTQFKKWESMHPAQGHM